jgi:hypothetical protein
MGVRGRLDHREVGAIPPAALRPPTVWGDFYVRRYFDGPAAPASLTTTLTTTLTTILPVRGCPWWLAASPSTLWAAETY